MFAGDLPFSCDDHEELNLILQDDLNLICSLLNMDTVTILTANVMMMITPNQLILV